MNTYKVEVMSEKREVYYVLADSEGEALHAWHSGEMVLQEAHSAEPVSVEMVDPEEDGLL